MRSARYAFSLHFAFDDREQEVDAEEVDEGADEQCGVGEVQDLGEGQYGADDGEEQEDAFVGDFRGFAASEEVFPGFEAVVGPGDEGGEREQGHCEGQDQGEPGQDPWRTRRR